MQRDDLAEVAEIEAASHRPPWPNQIFLEELEREWAYLDVVRVPGEGPERSRVAAFCNYWLVRDEVHLLNIAVHPDHRRAGHGGRLMQRLVDFARARQCRFITLEVRKSNSQAIAMYRRFGFVAVGLRPRYYAEDGEDAIVMTLELPAATD